MERLYKYTRPKEIYHYLCRQELSFTSMKVLNDPVEGTPDLTRLVELAAEHMQNTGSDASQPSTIIQAWRLFKNILKDVGVLSLSTCPRIPLMWSHYADMSGLSLGLSTRSQVLSNQQAFKLPGVPQKVAYEQTRHPYETPTMDVRFLCLQKGTDWEYESEYRYFREIEDGTERVVLNFEASDLEDIVMGIGMSLDNALLVQKFWQGKYPHATLRIAYPSQKEYAVDICPAPTDPEEFESFFTDSTQAAAQEILREHLEQSSLQA